MTISQSKKSRICFVKSWFSNNSTIKLNHDYVFNLLKLTPQNYKKKSKLPKKMERTIKTYSDDHNRLQLVQVDKAGYLIYQIRLNRHIKHYSRSLVDCNKRFQALVYNLNMQCEI